MISVILGNKGSGKTKKILALCAAATKASNGNVVFIAKDNSLTYDLSHKTRLVATDEYQITDYDAFYGFIAGMCAGNYDITDIFVDSTLKIGGRDYEQLAAFLKRLSVLNTKIVLTVSDDKEKLPASVAEYAE